MDSPWLVLAALLLGLVIGSGFAIGLIAAARRGERIATVVAPSVPDGVSQVLDALESAGIVVDPSGNVVKASPGALALGLIRDGMLAHPEFVSLADRVRDGGEPVTEDIDIVRGRFSDVVLHLGVRGARLGTRYVLLLATDHTESRRLDEVRRDFIANISHELKTPIGAVGLLAEALEPAADDPDQVRRFAARLGTEASRLARLTGEIIDLSRLQAADALNQPELLDVDRVVAAALDQNRVAADAGGVTLVSAGDEGARVYGDEALLVVAVHNLISNAITYSPPRGRVGVGISRKNGVIEIAVTDQGPGIPEEDRERVFERFFRIDQARSRNTGGTGLGLSIVKHTIQNHGGEVKVWSLVGKGSTFTIRLPEASEKPLTGQIRLPVDTDSVSDSNTEREDSIR
ncbi:two-component sensor histidine kinase [Mycetocola manganoxydans]|uniref:Sensor-like histidine kinase SenX3 n=1 Tax=Mycetocola manganoxydans TaxID=699879 RepID=A0A3L6ZVT6_9MICO|nr:ATP-binding protein [Mycetocola manganoxydans]RLP72113.1 two-component sensor histidine kinase [Mycetocola manganoxydans]GHD47987.1 two-component sensor histidine kinase [Mycetocola manganoxydans]